MGSTAEFQKMIRQRDDRIAELERTVSRQRDVIDDLNSKLDKIQTVMHDQIRDSLGPGAGSGEVARKRARATGISAEPGGMPQSQRASKSQHEFTKEMFKVHPKSNSSRTLIHQAIVENQFMRHLSPACISEIVELVRPVEFRKGSLIIQEGDEGSEVFILEEGNLTVEKDGKELRLMKPPTVFGELAVLYNCTRTASIKAETACKVWSIERKVYHGLMVRMEMRRQKTCVELLKRIPKFKAQSEEILNQMADILEETHYDNGQHIIRQGARGDTFYIIAEGTVKETKRNQSGAEETVRKLVGGDWFGEKALEGEEVRGSSYITADANGVDCLVLDRETYVQLMRKIEDVHRMSRDEGRRTSSKQSVSEAMCLSDLNIIATIGVGGFSRVQLVQIKGDASSRTYALKTMKKHVIRQLKQEEHVLNEKTIMSESKCDFISRLYRTFKDNKHLYMLMEACLGGEIWTLLRNRGMFDDNGARFYTACVVEAFRYLHNRGIVYRDLKPENMLLDSHGYVKLVDFGFAKKIKVGVKTWTFCGTPEYVAPEIILNKGHDHSADLWSLGVLIYELLTGSPPFQGPDQMQIYNGVLKGIDAVEFARQIGKYPKHLIKKLCRDNPSDRLGYGRGGMKEIEKHKWFEIFNWDGLRQKTLKAPYPVYIKTPTDTSNFDKFPDDNEAEVPDDLTGWDRNF